MAATMVAIANHLSGDDLDALLRAPATALAEGRLVGFPTETVYGLGANARCDAACARVFQAKRRPSDNPLIVHIADLTDLGGVAHATPLAWDLATRFWPGPLTLVLDRVPGIADVVTAGGGTVAVRLPDSAVARSLIRQSGVPVAAPSANRSGRPSPTTAAHVLADLGEDLDWIVDAGPCAVGIESTVVDARGAVPVMLREGGVPRELLGPTAQAGTDGPPSPGTRHRHYTPDAEVRIALPGQGGALASALARGGRRIGLIAPPGTVVADGVHRMHAPEDGAALARVLYGELRSADALELDVIVVEAISESGVGRAVMDRLRRAAS